MGGFGTYPQSASQWSDPRPPPPLPTAVRPYSSADPAPTRSARTTPPDPPPPLEIRSEQRNPFGALGTAGQTVGAGQNKDDGQIEGTGQTATGRIGGS